MTKEITKANILQEIEDKFKLRELEAERFAFSELVIPIYDVGNHLIRPRTEYVEKSITSATAFLFFTVPQNERWYLRGYNVVFLAAGAYTVTGLYVNRVNRSPSDAYIYLDMVEGQTVSYAKNLPTPVRLNPGDKLSLLIDSYTSTASLRLHIDFTVEEIR